MIKRILSILLIAVMLVCTFCAGGDDDDIALIMPITSDPLCLDPQIAETETAITIINAFKEASVPSKGLMF